MNPEESTGTTTIRTRRHPRRYRKISEAVPHTGLVDTEYRKVFWLHHICIVLVRNSQRTPFHVVDTSGMELSDRRAGAGIVGVIGVTDIATVRRSEKRRCTFVAPLKIC
jgi:hypothetical protein